MTALPVGTLSGKSGLRLGLPDYILFSMWLLAASLWLFPQTALAQSSPPPKTPVLAFDIESKNQIYETLLSQLVSPHDQTPAQESKLEILRNWLESKGSPLQAYAPLLLMQDKKIMTHILSVAHAESNLCKHQLGNNCWGIGGAKYHRFYSTFAEGIVDASNLIKKYHDGGLNTPEKMMRRWVGWNNSSWVVANKQILAELKALDI